MKIILTLLLFFPLQILAQEEAVEIPEPVPPCSGAKHHQFDFWIGDWQVTSAGQIAGTNSIHEVHNGCALQENWQGSGSAGISGSSYNIYDRANDKWHQTWIDSSGTLLELDGGLINGSMVMQGERPAASGSGLATHRITWTANSDGSVRQLWEATQDGETWTVLFDGLYEKMPVEL